MSITLRNQTDSPLHRCCWGFLRQVELLTLFKKAPNSCVLGDDFDRFSVSSFVCKSSAVTWLLSAVIFPGIPYSPFLICSSDYGRSRTTWLNLCEPSLKPRSTFLLLVKCIIFRVWSSEHLVGCSETSVCFLPGVDLYYKRKGSLWSWRAEFLIVWVVYCCL